MQDYSDLVADLVDDEEAAGGQFPIRGTITSRPGASRDGGRRKHAGTDIAAAKGTPIPWDWDEEGEVVFAGPKGGYGNLVEIRARGKKRRYAHLDGFDVNVGDRVTRGQVFGRVGNTGKVMGKNGGFHLHYEEVDDDGAPSTPRVDYRDIVADLEDDAASAAPVDGQPAAPAGPDLTDIVADLIEPAPANSEQAQAAPVKPKTFTRQTRKARQRATKKLERDYVGEFGRAGSALLGAFTGGGGAPADGFRRGGAAPLGADALARRTDRAASLLARAHGGNTARSGSELLAPAHGGREAVPPVVESRSTIGGKPREKTLADLQAEQADLADRFYYPLANPRTGQRFGRYDSMDEFYANNPDKAPEGYFRGPLAEMDEAGIPEQFAASRSEALRNLGEVSAPVRDLVVGDPQYNADPSLNPFENFYNRTTPDEGGAAAYGMQAIRDAVLPLGILGRALLAGGDTAEAAKRELDRHGIDRDLALASFKGVYGDEAAWIVETLATHGLDAVNAAGSELGLRRERPSAIYKPGGLGGQIGAAIGQTPYVVGLSATGIPAPLVLGGLEAVSGAPVGFEGQETDEERGARIAGGLIMGGLMSPIGKLIPAKPFAALGNAIDERIPGAAALQLGERLHGATALAATSYPSAAVLGQEMPTWQEAIRTGIVGAGIGPAGGRVADMQARQRATADAAQSKARAVEDYRKLIADPNQYKADLEAQSRAATAMRRVAAGDHLRADPAEAQRIVAEADAAAKQFPELTKLDAAALGLESRNLMDRMSKVDEALKSPTVARQHREAVEKRAVELEREHRAAVDEATRADEIARTHEADVVAAETALEQAAARRAQAEAQVENLRQFIAAKTARGEEVTSQDVLAADAQVNALQAARLAEAEMANRILTAKEAATNARAEHERLAGAAKETEGTAAEAAKLRAGADKVVEGAREAVRARQEEERATIEDPEQRAELEAGVDAYLKAARSDVEEGERAAMTKAIVDAAHELGAVEGVDAEIPLTTRIEALTQAARVDLGPTSTSRSALHEIVGVIRDAELLDSVDRQAINDWVQGFPKAERGTALFDAIETVIRDGQLPDGHPVGGVFERLAGIAREMYRPMFEGGAIDPGELAPDVRELFEYLVGPKVIADAERVTVDETGSTIALEGKSNVPEDVSLAADDGGQSDYGSPRGAGRARVPGALEPGKRWNAGDRIAPDDLTPRQRAATDRRANPAVDSHLRESKAVADDGQPLLLVSGNGSPEAIAELDPAYSRFSRARGVFTSPAPAIGQHYAGDNGNVYVGIMRAEKPFSLVESHPYGDLRAIDPEAALIAARMAGVTDSSTLIPGDYFYRALRDVHLNRAGGERHNAEAEWAAIESATKSLQEAGYDSLFYRFGAGDARDADVWVAFEKGQFRHLDDPLLHDPDATLEPSEPSVRDRLQSIEDEALARAKDKIARMARGEIVNAGLPVSVLGDLAVWGGAKLARKSMDFATWSKAMVEQWGDVVRPHLAEIYERAKEHAEEFAKPEYLTTEPLDADAIGGKPDADALQAAKAAETAETAAPRVEGKSEPADYTDAERQWNPRTSGLSDEHRNELNRRIVERRPEGGYPNETREPHTAVQENAAMISPDLVSHVAQWKKGDTIPPKEVVLAAREYAEELSRQADETFRQLDAGVDQKGEALTAEARATLERKAAELESSAIKIIQGVVPIKTEMARGLASLAIRVSGGMTPERGIQMARRLARQSGHDLDSKSWKDKETNVGRVATRDARASQSVADLAKALERGGIDVRQLVKSDGTPVTEAEAITVARNAREAKVRATLTERLAEREAAARARLAEKRRALAEGRSLGSGLDPTMLADIVDIGASMLARKTIDAATWAREMVAEFGDEIRPHLGRIRNDAAALIREERQRIRGEQIEARAIEGADPETFEPADVTRLVQEYVGQLARQQKARRELLRVMTDIQTQSWVEIIAAVRKAGLLTGLKTHLRNVVGTAGYAAGLEEVARIPSALVDAAVSIKTKRRTVTGASVTAASRAGYSAATKGIGEALQIMRDGATQEQMDRLEISRELATKSKILNAYVNTVFRALAAEDRVAKVFVITRALEGRARAQALTERRTNKSLDVKERTRELVENPPEDLMADAIAEADFATFNNENPVASAYQSARQKLMNQEVGGGRPGRAVVVGLDLVMPFVRTPTNILARIIDYSPLGFGKAGVNGARMVRGLRSGEFDPAHQEAFARGIGRASTGTAIIALGAMLGRAGLMTGTRDDDPSKRERDAAAGRSPMSIQLGGDWHSIGAFSPFGNLLAIGATLQREHDQERRDPSAMPAKLAAAAAGTVLEQPMLKGTKDVLDALMRPSSSGERLTGSIMAGFVPTAISDIASALDDTRRDARGVVPSMANRIPGARNLLPESYDALGRPSEQRRLNAINPLLSTTARELTDPVDRELVAMDVGVSRPARKPGETDEEFRSRAKTIGDERYRKLTEVVGSNKYAAASAEERREMLEDTIRNASREASADPVVKMAVDFDMSPPKPRARTSEKPETFASREARTKEVWREAVRVYAPEYLDLSPDEKLAKAKELKKKVQEYVEARIDSEFPPAKGR